MVNYNKKRMNHSVALYRLLCVRLHESFGVKSVLYDKNVYLDTLDILDEELITFLGKLFDSYKVDYSNFEIDKYFYFNDNFFSKFKAVFINEKKRISIGQLLKALTNQKWENG